MYVNGMVIQKYADNPYRGIDGSGFSVFTGQNWFLNFEDGVPKDFEDYYDENIGMTYYDLADHTWVAACTDMAYIHRYIEEAKKRHINYRLLLCETDIPQPNFECPDLRMTFLGYDYAYTSGDNYSAVYNEIPCVFPQFRLNRYGLFDTREEIEEYLAAREEFTRTHPPHTHVTRDVAVLRLHQIYH